jgi:hypothetical protein
MSGASRREAWANEDVATQLRLAINELDEFDGRIEKIASSITRRLNWILGLFIGSMVALLANLIMLVVTRV